MLCVHGVLSPAEVTLGPCRTPAGLGWYQVDKPLCPLTLKLCFSVFRRNDQAGPFPCE